MRNYKRKKPKAFHDFNKAIRLVEEGSSVRQAACMTQIPEATLRRHIKNHNEGKETASAGMHTALPKSCEKELHKMIALNCEWGFASNREEIIELVRDFVRANKSKDTPEGRHINKYCFFKNDTPGPDWIRKFMDRWHLSFKQPSTFEKAQMHATSDPDIIHGYFDLLESQIDNIGRRGIPECVLNCEETNLCTDPSKSNVIAPKANRAARVTATSRDETVTVMAAVSAAGYKSPQIPLFKNEDHSDEEELPVAATAQQPSWSEASISSANEADAVSSRTLLYCKGAKRSFTPSVTPPAVDTTFERLQSGPGTSEKGKTPLLRPEKRARDETQDFESVPEAQNIKSEVCDGELEHITVKEEPID